MTRAVVQLPYQTLPSTAADYLPPDRSIALCCLGRKKAQANSRAPLRAHFRHRRHYPVERPNWYNAQQSVCR